MSGSGLSRHLPPALWHSFLALCFCFRSCSLFSALQSLSPLCPELSRGFPLTLRKSQSFYMGPQSSQRHPRPRLCQLPAPNAHLCSNHVEFPAPPGNCWTLGCRSLCPCFGSVRNVLPRCLHGSLLCFLRSFLKCPLLSDALPGHRLPQVFVPFLHFVLF